MPPAIFGTEKAPRPTPYILTTEDIRRLINAAARSMSRALCAATYSTLFALLACTGLRVSEAIRLRIDDITPDGLVFNGSAIQFRTDRIWTIGPGGSRSRDCQVRWHPGVDHPGAGNVRPFRSRLENR